VFSWEGASGFNSKNSLSQNCFNSASKVLASRAKLATWCRGPVGQDVARQGQLTPVMAALVETGKSSKREKSFGAAMGGRTKEVLSLSNLCKGTALAISLAEGATGR
jgi:hypothetical protein